MFLLASYGCEGVNLETNVNQMAWVSHYSPIFRDTAGQLSVRPEYYGILAFALAGRGNLVKLTASETDVNLSAYATKSSEGPFWVAVVNKDLSRQANVEITLPQGCSRAEADRLTAPSVESRDQVTLAGAQVSAEGVWSSGSGETITVSLGVASLELPASGAILVRLIQSR